MNIKGIGIAKRNSDVLGAVALIDKPSLMHSERSAQRGFGNYIDSGIGFYMDKICRYNGTL